jgi:hypothetical protein
MSFVTQCKCSEIYIISLRLVKPSPPPPTNLTSLGCQEGFPGIVIIAHVCFSHVVMHLSQFFVISCFKRAMQHAPMTKGGERGTSLERAMHHRSLPAGQLLYSECHFVPICLGKQCLFSFKDFFNVIA